MTTSQLKTRLELLKLALGCLALFMIAISSCENHLAATRTLQRLDDVEAVVQEVAQGVPAGATEFELEIE